MSNVAPSNRLDRPVDEARDHILGRSDAEISLVEYGSYACSSCRAANEAIADVRGQLGDRVRYVFRHRPLTGSDIARRAAELVQRADSAAQFWGAHIKLMTRSEKLSEDDLRAVADELGLRQDDDSVDAQAIRRAKARVEADERSARASGVTFTPTFFLNGRRYDGPWDEGSLTESLRGQKSRRPR
jgi:Na+:H+ antiporter, NhaA family